MNKNIDKSTTYLFSKHVIIIIYSIALVIILALQYGSYVQQITKNQLDNLSIYIRSRLSIIKNYSYDNFKLIEYLEQTKSLNDSIKLILNNNRVKEIFLLSEVYKYDNKTQNLLYLGKDKGKGNIKIQNLKTNPTILKCIENKKELKFGQIYIDDYYRIVSCYGGEKYIYLRLTNINKLIFAINKMHKYAKNYNIVISDKYNQVLYSSNSKTSYKNLSNITTFKYGMLFLDKSKEKRYTKINGYDLYEKSYSLATLKDKSFKIYIEKISTPDSQKFIKFIQYNKLLVITDLVIFFILVLCVLKGIIYPLSRVISPLQKYIKLDNEKDLSYLKAIHLLKKEYFELRNKNKLVYFKYNFINKFLKKFINNYQDDYKNLLHNFNTPLHQIQSSIQSIKAKSNNMIIDDEKINIIDEAVKQLIGNCEQIFNNKKLLNYSLDSKKSYVCLVKVINDLSGVIFNINPYYNIKIIKDFTATNAVIIADKVFIETIMYQLLSSFKKLIDKVSVISINLHEILTGLEISIIFEGNRIQKDSVEKYIDYIDNKLDLNYYDESKLDILIVNYLVNLLKLDLSLQSNDNKTVSYKLVIPNIKLKS